jgi:hypothetical protein
MSIDDFDITSVVSQGSEAAKAPKVVSLFRRGEPSDDSLAGAGELAESSPAAEDSGEGEGDAPVERAAPARRVRLAPDVTPGERTREAEAVRRAREAAASAQPEEEDAGPAALAPGAAAAAKPGAPAAQGATGAGAPKEETDAELMARIRKREQEQHWREEAQGRAKAEADAILAKAREDAARELAASREIVRKEMLDKLRTNPGGALREWDIAPDKFLGDIAAAHTPEGQMRMALAQQQAEIAALKASLETRTKQEAEAAQHAQTHVEAQRKAGVESAFLSEASDTAAPGLRLLYDEPTILAKSYEVARARMARGESCTNAEIIAELERTTQERLGTLRQKLGGSPGAAAPAARANGPRTMSAAATGERMSSPKPVEEMTDDEREKHEAAVVRSVREQYAAKRKAKTASP